MSTTLRSAKTIDFCTPSISYDAQVQAAGTAFDRQMYEIIDETAQVLIQALIAEALPDFQTTHPDRPAPPPPPIDDDELLTDILAWQFHVDFYDKSKPLAFRKQLVALSIQWHMTKGTVKLVEDVLAMYFGSNVTLQEWYEYMDPLPPNYPIDDPDGLVTTFTPSNVDVAGDKFLINAHGLTANKQIKFKLGNPTTGPDVLAPKLPAPLIPEIYYYVANPHTNDFQLSPSPNQPVGDSISGSIINLTDAGNGTNSIYRRGTGSWHDRYRFRVLVDSNFIDPDDQRIALALIDRYKPVSRWLEGFVRAHSSTCDIGVTGMLLRFIYRTSEAPDYP